MTLCCANVNWAIGDVTYGQWSDLDRLLVQLWESHPIRSMAVVFTKRVGESKKMRDRVGRLLPEITKKGEIDNVES
jgi:hypothetical protein